MGKFFSQLKNNPNVQGGPSTSRGFFLPCKHRGGVKRGPHATVAQGEPLTIKDVGEASNLVFRIAEQGFEGGNKRLHDVNTLRGEKKEMNEVFATLVGVT